MIFSILISDEQYLTKEGLKSIIKDNQEFKLIDREVGKPEKWTESIKNLKPDIFVTDYQLYEGDTEDNIIALKNISKITNVLIISDDQKSERVRKVIDLGIKGFLTKHCSPEEVKTCLSSIKSGNRFFCQTIMSIILNSNSPTETVPALKDLSEREYEVLKLIGKGFTSKEISEKLFISIHTVNSHRKNLLRKLDMKSPAQLIVFALENL
ncbi:MAG: response regulator transcription factor [Bacteroidota bacterium]